MAAATRNSIGKQFGECAGAYREKKRRRNLFLVSSAPWKDGEYTDVYISLLLLGGIRGREKERNIRNLIAVLCVLWVARQSITGVLAAAGPSCETSAQPLLLCSFHPRLSPSDSPTLLPFELFRPDRYNLYQALEFYPTDSAWDSPNAAHSILVKLLWCSWWK